MSKSDAKHKTFREGASAALRNSIKDNRAIRKGQRLVQEGSLREQNRSEIYKTYKSGIQRGREGEAELFAAGVELGRNRLRKNSFWSPQNCQFASGRTKIQQLASPESANQGPLREFFRSLESSKF